MPKDDKDDENAEKLKKELAEAAESVNPDEKKGLEKIRNRTQPGGKNGKPKGKGR